MPIEFGVVSNVTFVKPELDRFLNSPSGEVGQYLKKASDRIIVAAKRQVGKQTHLLEKSIHSIHTRGTNSQEMWIGSDLDIALLHHEGTRPHAIEARQTQFLRYSKQGRVVYARRVMHPGTKPNRYLSDNLPLAFA